MSASQLLNRSNRLGAPEFKRFLFPNIPGLKSASTETIVAALGILHARFASTETLELGKYEPAELKSNQITSYDLVIESKHTVNQVLANVNKRTQTRASELPKNCAIVCCFASDGISAFCQQHISQIEVAYEFDCQAGQLAIHARIDLFDQRTISNWSTAFQRILEQVIQAESTPSAGDQVIGEIDIIDQKSKLAMLDNGRINDDSTKQYYSLEPSKEFTFHRCFEKQVKATPERIAVWAKQNSDAEEAVEWSYRELNHQSNLVARFLIDSGIKLEDSVGIVMNRRVNLLASLIGVMKAGGRYVALEPELPVERLAYMVNDSAVNFIITEEPFSDRTLEMKAACEHSDQVTILNWDSESYSDFQKSASSTVENPNLDVHSQNCAYTIYTSGSTGTPKGVEIYHHTLVNFCHVFVKQLGFTEHDTSAAIATIAFDASVGELYPLLLVGGRVAIGHKQVGANGQQLSSLIESVDATYMAATPTSLRVLVASGWTESPNLTVIAGGEAVTPMVLDEIAPRVKRVINGYGPTECTVYSSFGELKAGLNPVPLGGPLLNTKLYVLDDFGQPVPPMVRGNLFIGGQCQARGYLNRPELTAEKFPTDTFVDSSVYPNARMYDSGDVVYWDHDGTLFYIGRSDHQAKLRGYRIELGEIEAKLKSHPNVKDAVAMVREDVSGQQRLVAYVIFQQSTKDVELQDHLSVNLPDYMVPTWFVPLETFPTNANSKLDRNALPKPEDVLVDDEFAENSAAPNLEQQHRLAVGISKIWSSILNRKIGVQDHVFRMGADSLTAVKFQIRLREELDHDISVAEVFQFPTAVSLAQQLLGGADQQFATPIRTVRPRRNETCRDIAVIGMAARFPESPNLEKFWENLINGVESFRDFTPEELREAGVLPHVYSRPNYIPRGSILDGSHDFEPEFFGVTRSDAEILSPQIRLFMKTTWEALEHGGYPIEPENGRIGVFAGGGLPNYLAPWRHIAEPQRLQRLIGNGADFLATRTSYALGLTGPSVVVQTACSTSLVAVAQACQSLRNQECEFAIAGGSSFSWPHAQGYEHGEGLIYSSDGHCRAFDSRASGTIFSQGAGAVLLRPLDDAIAAGDTIHSVIRGVGVNNDGNRKGGYAAPSIEGQSEVIQMAIEDAGISPREITYVEAHGTGTKIGDPIEIQGLSNAWRRYTNDKQFCSIGSVKTNIGHADAAAGIAGLLKVILSLKHQKLAPNLNFDQPNPAIKFEDSPFFVQTEAGDWQGNDDTRIAAISAFGMGGTNAHAIVAQPPAVADKNPDSESGTSGYRLIPFSARTKESLDQLFEDWQQSELVKSDTATFSNVAFTLQQGRKHFGKRAFAIAKSKNDILTAIENRNSDTEPLRIIQSSAKACRRKVAFLFTGQGAQYAKMAKQIYQEEPVFRETLDRCDELLQQQGTGLLSWLFSDSPTVDINQTQYAQVALFSVAYAQSQLWQSWGVQPAALIGHSIGEYVAATVAGVFTLEDAIKIVSLRGRLMQSMPTGSMLAVMHGTTPIEELISAEKNLDLAVVNSHAVAVVAGKDKTIEEFASRLESKGINSKILQTSHAFHSRMMDPMLDEFTKAVEAVTLSAPKTPYLSNVTGTWITDQDATAPEYYASQIRSTVRFADNLANLVDDDQEDLLLIEMGPGATLARLAESQLAGSNHAAISTIPSAKESTKENTADSHQFTRIALGRAWAAGVELDWAKIETQSANPHRIPLPTYRFNEQTYQATPESIGADNLKTDDGRWYNVPSWQQAHLDQHQAESDQIKSDKADSIESDQPSVWLVLASEDQISDADAKKWFTNNLSNKGSSDKNPDDKNLASIVRVRVGEQFSKSSETLYEVRPGESEDYRKLVEEVAENVGSICGVVHGWTISDESSPKEDRVQDFWAQQQHASISLGWLAKALGEIAFESSIPLNVLTRGSANFDSTGAVHPANHGFIGGCSVIQKEFPSLVTKVLDLGSSPIDAVGNSKSWQQLLTSTFHEPLLTFGMGRWWKKTYEQVDLASEGQGINNDSVYVFTGGLGSLARNMAIKLATRYSGLKIALLARTDLPERSSWPAVLESSDDESLETRLRISDIQQLETLCDVKIIQTDVSDPQQLSAGLASVRESYGAIDGFLHTAGVLRDGALATKDPETLKQVFAAKALSAKLCFDELLASHSEIGFVVLFSSIASDIGLFGQYDYSAANSYLDGLSEQMNASGLNTFTINWPAFSDVGMAARSQAGVTDQTALQTELLENSFLVEEGTTALVEIINNREQKRVVLSKQPFASRYQFYIDDGRETCISGDSAASSQSSDKVPSEQMLEIWQQQFGNDTITLDDDYFELGGDSLMAIGMIVQIEKSLGKLIPISFLINSPTPRKLIKKMGLSDEGPAADEANGLPAWIVPLRESKSGPNVPPLFLVHGADGAVMFYRQFANQLSVDRPVYAIESPFIQDTKYTIPETVELIAQQYVQGILKVQPKGPYAIGGYSFGGAVAYEIAQQLIGAGKQVENLILYDMPNPANLEHSSAVERLKSFWNNQEASSAIAKSLKLTKRVGQAVKDRATFEIENRLSTVKAQNGEADGFWRHKSARERHMAIEQDYEPQSLSIRLQLVVATGNSSKFRTDDTLGWDGLPAEIDKVEVAGSHLELFDDQYVEALVEATNTFLGR